MKRFALLLPVVVACAQPQSGDLLCDGQCDDLLADDIVWNVSAGLVLANCDSAAGSLECELRPDVPASVAPQSAMFGQLLGGTFLGGTTIEPGERQRFGNNSHLMIRGIRAFNRDLAFEVSGSTEISLPYDVRRFTFTRLDDADYSLFFSHDVVATEGSFLVSQNTGDPSKTHMLSALSYSGDEASKSVELPITGGAQVPIFINATSAATRSGSIAELGSGGCYLLSRIDTLPDGSVLPRIERDEGCQRSQARLEELGQGSTTEEPPAACECDESSECDTGCECDTACEIETGPQCVEGTANSCDDDGESFEDGKCCVSPELQCVEGTANSCDDEGESWTGALCCVDKSMECVPGTFSSCDNEGESWTGSECCVPDTLQCVSGTFSSCDDEGEGWTGELCCVTDEWQCVSGTFSSCDDEGESWTGTECCVADTLQCVSGTFNNCDDPGETWTGSECCVEAAGECTEAGSSSQCADGDHFTGTHCCPKG